MKLTFRKDNRKIQRKHVEDIKESIKSHGYMMHAPIVLNNDGEIIDGQHRYIACCELGITPPTITVDANDDLLMVDLNRSQKSWGIEDFINFYAEMGKPSYIMLRRFCKFAKLATTPCILILTKGIGFVGFDKLRCGEFVIDIDDKTVTDKIQIADDITFIARQIGLHRGNKAITQAYLSLMDIDGFDRDYFMSKIKRYKDRLSICSSQKSYIQMFVSVYNYNNRGGGIKY